MSCHRARGPMAFKEKLVAMTKAREAALQLPRSPRNRIYILIRAFGKPAIKYRPCQANLGEILALALGSHPAFSHV